MYTIREAKQQILRELKNAVGKGFTPAIDMLEEPPTPEMGDIAFPCFALAKSMKRAPDEIATEIAAKIGPKEFISKIKAKGPYVNFFFDDAQFGQAVLGEISEMGADYGQSKTGEGKRVMVEYAQPNTHKVIHVGHLRNFTVGHMTVNVLKENGFDVVPVSYINDLGMHVAKCLWGLNQYFSDADPDKSERMELLAEAYVKATEAMNADESVHEEVSQIHRDLEKRTGNYLKRWKTTRQWSLDYIKDVFDALSLPIEKWYYESDLISDTRDLIEDLIERGIVVHSEGAWIVDLQDEDLGVNLLVKSDETLLYNAKDITLALQKDKDYDLQRSIYVIDARQSHAMQQLFTTLKRMGFKKELSHLSYEFVTLAEGAMSSRKGNVVKYEDFRDKMVEMAKRETRDRHDDWEDQRVQDVAEQIANTAMRFDMLKQDLDKKIVFDLERALSFDGFTGPYLLYTNARVSGILEKADTTPDIEALDEMTEYGHRLLTVLAEYPDVVFTCGTTLQLSILPQYLYKLAKTFAAFYENVSVLQADDEDLVKSRLALVQAVGQVMENGLDLMGIEPIKAM